MKICDEHEEIVHDGKHCPLCLAIEQIKELEKERDELTQKIISLGGDP